MNSHLIWIAPDLPWNKSDLIKVTHSLPIFPICRNAFYSCTSRAIEKKYNCKKNWPEKRQIPVMQIFATHGISNADQRPEIPRQIVHRNSTSESILIRIPTQNRYRPGMSVLTGVKSECRWWIKCTSGFYTYMFLRLRIGEKKTATLLRSHPPMPSVMKKQPHELPGDLPYGLFVLFTVIVPLENFISTVLRS